jgi:hypothetical protein
MLFGPSAPWSCSHKLRRFDVFLVLQSVLVVVHTELNRAHRPNRARCRNSAGTATAQLDSRRADARDPHLRCRFQNLR